VTSSREPSDDKLIALAIDSGARVVISGNPDPQHLGMHHGVEILSPALFFERYKPQ
jgi:predicted nucleic acid-binding protein